VKELESKELSASSHGRPPAVPKGALEGPSIMPGGTRAPRRDRRPGVPRWLPRVEDGPPASSLHRPVGAGQLRQTVHNGI